MKVILLILIVLFGVIAALIDIGGAILYTVVLGYFAGLFYLVEKVPFFKKLFAQLPGTESMRWSHMITLPLVLPIIILGMTIVDDDKTFSKLEFVLVVLGAFLIYFLRIFLPAIVRIRRNSK